MVRLSAVIISLFLIFSFQAQAKSPPPGTGTSDIPANILIMLDNSGSMSAKLYNSVQVYYPLDVATDSSGNVYVMEYYNNRIKVFNSSGVYLRSFGGYGSGCNQWQYARQFSIYNDIIYIADTYGHKIKSLSLTGSCKNTGSTGFNYPHAIAVNSNYVFVGHSNSTISVMDYRLNQRTNQSFSNHINYSWGMSFNKGGNKLLVSSFYKNQLVEFSVNGDWLTYLQKSPSSYTNTNGYFQRPTDTGYDSSGNIYAVDLYNHRIQKFNSSLVYQAKTGSYLTSSGFRYPYGMHIDSSDNIYVTDFNNYAVRVYDTNLTETTTYGGGGGSRLSAAKKVIKKIVSNTDLTSGANFGLMEWGTRHNIRVKISDTGAKEIYSNVDGVYASGGTDLNRAMINARNYFTSGQVANWNLTCSLNYLIVISDGYWHSHNSVINITNQMRSVNNIKTFAVGFALGGASSNYSTLATAGGTVKPLYASNETELLQKLTDAIKQAISGRLTFTTPAVMSDVSRNNFVYQSTFEYAKNIQWKGSLKKYKLNNNGSFGAVQWNAADKLNTKSSSSRNIWTPEISTSINNFTTSNRDALKSRMFPSQSPTDTEVENLINFIRGVDVYDQDSDNNKTESIHKLADIYHSDLIIVGKPEAPAIDDGSINSQKKDSYYRLKNNYNNFKNGSTCGGLCSNRKEIVYAGANNGILHAFDSSNGEELWGYIPPNVLGNLEKIPSSKANSTNAIYGIDGSPVVKDIYFDDTPNDGTVNPRWRTILLGGLGAGGKGLYAIDITNPDSPTHLFAIRNDESNKVVQHWGLNTFKNEFGYAGGSIDPKYDYRKLGETWSTPKIIRIKVDSKDKWVAVFGGGYNGAVNPDVGSAVFVLDLEDEGRLLKVIDIEDTAKQSYSWTGQLGSRVGGILTNNNTVLEVSKWLPGISYDSSKGESLIAEFNPPVGHTITYSNNGTVSTVTKVTFDSAWPGPLGGGATGTATFRRIKNDIVNSLPADLSVITASGTNKANYNGAMIYATDLEGKVTKINLTENFIMDTNQNSSSYNSIIRPVASDKSIHQTTLFTTEATSVNGRYIYTRPEVTINNDSNLWLYFGTGNTQKLQSQSSEVKNRLYGIKDVNFPNFVKVNPGNVSMCKTAPTCPGGVDLGWYVDLKKSQKLTAEPTVDKDRVYFPIYEPISTNNKCGIGNAILRAFDSKCGNSVLNVNIGKGVLSKVVINNGNLYIGLSGEANKNIAGFTSKDNLITGKSNAKAASGAVQLESWKENY
ncbi:PilC/PilY family type IV pilus protein [Candidatus Pelagibacter bacterium]|nr:PilC/PilY family type IV pilus protein [Candidatus Pelagibacter bacterium]MDB4217354.1 PilC/PilY family type IV pilus protein [Candidatus Pelagibacter sp.]